MTESIDELSIDVMNWLLVFNLFADC
jgi:hypothetical protein